MSIQPQSQIDQTADPNVSQRMASNPQESIWVGASAGTGKTKVLTDRVLRLLLPRDNDAAGTPPSKILCLTFTKAAASEMALRINRTLGEWAVINSKNLHEKLTDLLGKEPTQKQFKSAQTLFAQVMDSPGGLQIMTIHSFCSSVLGRFPLEASLPPNFNMMEEGAAKELLQRAQKIVIERAQSPEEAGSPLADAVHRIAGFLDEKSFAGLIGEIAAERRQFSELLAARNIDQIYAGICSYYGVQQNESAEAAIRSACADGRFMHADLERVAQAKTQVSGQAPKQGRIILNWLLANQDKRVELLEDYRDTFIKADGLPKTHNFPVKGVLAIEADAGEVLFKEATRLQALDERIKCINSAAFTRDVIIIGAAVMAAYEELKRLQGGLDFDDLILRTLDLLRGDLSSQHGKAPISAWVMYKLDQGLDHILVDEAQDTNPEHWKIIDTLWDEFFQGHSARDEILRSAFVVGDVKQSIYSFQRAAPEEFQRMHNVFENKIGHSGHIARTIDLEISFRTTRSVLRLVDRIFSDTELNRAVGGGTIRHISHRSDQAGVAEIWPLFKDDEKTARDLWSFDALDAARGKRSGASKLAEFVADKIAAWLKSGEFLSSAARPVQAGDIMILVRSRTAFVDQLVRELKLRNVPVSGVDRMRLGDQLVVQDMLAMMRFALLPEDDLNLACVLKSPLLGWSEDDLFALSHARKSSLWAELHNYTIHKFVDRSETGYPVLDNGLLTRTAAYLQGVIELVATKGAYEFFIALLHQSCPANDVSGLRAIKAKLGEDALDPLEELLNAALFFGRDQIDLPQMFLQSQERNETDIKREMEESGGKVRIMTVHGSKGLQAPIVIMPDTVREAKGRKSQRILWPMKTGIDFPLYAPRKDDAPEIYADLAQIIQDKSAEEEKRLLYVAMTRAADRLYVCGYCKADSKDGNDKTEGTWYDIIRKGFLAEGAEEIEANSLRLENAQTGEPDKRKKENARQRIIQTLPSWALCSAPDEPMPPRPLVPSRPSVIGAAPVAALSPLLAMQENRFRRGTLTHKLLQFLPDIQAVRQAAAAEHFVRKHGVGLSETEKGSVVFEVMKILNASDCAPFFSQGSLAEVAVTGLMPDGRIISGQIDRLVIGDKDIWILDYKTNRPPPTEVKDVPKAYLEQVAAYKSAIEAIYPSHNIHCALLWTDGPILMQL